MLIGVSGSGKQSLTKLSAYIMNMSLEKIEIVKNFNHDSFIEFLKELMKKAALKLNQLTFLFTDFQILSENFLEDLNNILNSGEIPNIWKQDEKEAIIS